MHSPARFASSTRHHARQQNSRPVGSPVVLAPALLKQVSGGSPKGGWQIQENFGEVLDVVALPKGGWL